jgi:hypothetical protein
MVNGHIGQVGHHVTLHVEMEGNYGQGDVRIQYPRIKGRTGLERVYRLVNAQKETAQVSYYILYIEQFK